MSGTILFKCAQILHAWQVVSKKCNSKGKERVYQCVEIRTFPHESHQGHVDSILEVVGCVEARKSQMSVDLQSIAVKIDDGQDTRHRYL